MLRMLFRLAVLVAVLYIGNAYLRPQIRAWRFRDAMAQTARFGGGEADESLRRSLLQAAHDLGVPLRVTDLGVHRTPQGRLDLSASWHEVVHLDAVRWRWVDTLHFDYEVEGATRETAP